MSEEHDCLTREIGKLFISHRKTEGENETNIDSPIDPTIWKFILLLSEKLDESTIPNLFGEQASPTTNLLMNMLENHKLRSTYDFEKAVGRKLEINKHLPVGEQDTKFVWNFRMLDAAAGTGTAVDTIFELKKLGVFRGAKRKLNFMCEDKQARAGHKCAKVDEMNDEMNDLLSSLELSNDQNERTVTRDKVKKKLSDTKAGWHGQKKTPPKLSPAEPKKKKRSVKQMGTPGQKQSLMLDFIDCTPKGKLTFGCITEEKGRSPK